MNAPIRGARALFYSRVLMQEASRPRRVAIADDSPAFLAAAANHIATLPGFMLAGTASTPPQTLALVASAAPDVLLLDLGLGRRRGLELVQQVKAYERLTVEAAIHGDRKAALKALLANPLVGRYNVATALLDALLDANRRHLPRFFGPE